MPRVRRGPAWWASSQARGAWEKPRSPSGPPMCCGRAFPAGCSSSICLVCPNSLRLPVTRCGCCFARSVPRMSRSRVISRGRASLYRSLLRDRRVLIVLDNAGSEEQVRPLLPGESPCRALITSRRLLAGLEGVRRLVLGPLELPEAKELLTGILGERAASDEESALTRLAELCEGLPLALRILGNRLVSRPGWDAAELAARLEGQGLPQAPRQ